MERYKQSANVVVGYSHQRSFRGPDSASKTADVDFDDVFGGPPRRYTTAEEMGYSLGERVGLETDCSSRGGGGGGGGGWSEKAVFGEESVNRRGRYTSGDFFDDIFRGEESSSYSSRRRSAPDPLRSSPIPLPLPLPLPPANSFPSHFRLPAESTFGSGSCSPSNGSIPYTPGTSLSRFSSQAIQGQDAFKNEMMIPSYRRNESSSSYVVKSGETDSGGDLKKDSIFNVENPSNSVSRISMQAIQGQDEFNNGMIPSYPQRFSDEFSLSSKEASYIVKSDETYSLKKDTVSVESPSSCNQFHFSIHKWASKGAQLVIPLRGGNSLKQKQDGKFERCSSSNARIGSHSLLNELQTQSSSSSESSTIAAGNYLFPKRSTQNTVESCEKTVFDMPESRYLNSFQSIIQNVPADITSSTEGEERKPHSLPEIGLREEMDKENQAFTQEARKPDLKSLRSLLNDDKDGPEKDELSGKDEEKGTSAKIAQVKHPNVDASKTVKKHDGRRIRPNKAEVSKATLKSQLIISGDSPGTNAVKGKVKEFVKIFNQEASSTSKVNVDTHQSSRGKATGTYGADNEASVQKEGGNGKKHMLEKTKIERLPVAPVMVNENSEQLDKEHSHMETIIQDKYFGPISTSAGSSESLPRDFKDPIGVIDELFQDNFVIKELTHEEDKMLQTSKDDENIQVSDVKVRQWSNGKAGNIRSLLSTLQYVLWPESGWKPVPLVDIIEGSAVKRAYQKALLCLHPDKLQQKGAASHQKYIAEKVFDLLQEAWDHFNSTGAL